MNGNIRDHGGFVNRQAPTAGYGMTLWPPQALRSRWGTSLVVTAGTVREAHPVLSDSGRSAKSSLTEGQGVSIIMPDLTGPLPERRGCAPEDGVVPCLDAAIECSHRRVNVRAGRPGGPAYEG